STVPRLSGSGRPTRTVRGAPRILSRRRGGRRVASRAENVIEEGVGGLPDRAGERVRSGAEEEREGRRCAQDGVEALDLVETGGDRLVVREAVVPGGGADEHRAWCGERGDLVPLERHDAGVHIVTEPGQVDEREAPVPPVRSGIARPHR